MHRSLDFDSSNPWPICWGLHISVHCLSLHRRQLFVSCGGVQQDALCKLRLLSPSTSVVLSPSTMMLGISGLGRYSSSALPFQASSSMRICSEPEWSVSVPISIACNLGYFTTFRSPRALPDKVRFQCPCTALQCYNSPHISFSLQVVRKIEGHKVRKNMSKQSSIPLFCMICQLIVPLLFWRLRTYV